VDVHGDRSDRAGWSIRLLAVLTAAVVVAPAFAPGFVLVNDMVFVPRQYLTSDALGLGGAPPRAVPADAVLAVVTAVLPGELVQKLVLAITVCAAVLGAARLVRPLAGAHAGLAAAVAGLVYGWSPYLAERLLMGHWSLLVGYAALPWVAAAALDLRAGRPRALARLVLAMAPAALVATGGLLATGVAVALGGRRRLGTTAGVGAVLALPWMVAGVLSTGGTGSDPDGVAAFAARGENWAGPVVAVLGGGGIWNGAAVPASRTSALAPLVTLLLVALACAGARRVLACWDRGPALGLAGLAAAGLVLACAGALPGLREALGAAVAAVPGAGLLRDGQKWAAWWLLAVAVGAGAGTARLVAALRAGLPGAASGLAAGSVAVGALLLPLVAVPDLAWGVGGRLAPVAYPHDWERVRAALADDPRQDAVLALPFAAVRSFAWNAGRPQLDPAPRYLPRPVVVDRTLLVAGPGATIRVGGEDARSAAAAAAAHDPAALAALGIGWVLVERGTPGPGPSAAVAALPRVVDGPWLTLLRVPDPVPAPGPGPVASALVVGAHLIAVAALAVAAFSLVVSAVTARPAGRPWSRHLSGRSPTVTVSARSARRRWGSG
jgi:hypothetical protein